MCLMLYADLIHAGTARVGALSNGHTTLFLLLDTLPLLGFFSGSLMRKRDRQEYPNTKNLLLYVAKS